MDTTNAEAAAMTLAQAWRERDQIDDLTEAIRPADVAEAYDVQDRMIDAIPAQPVGWKVGASNENAMRRFGFSEPFYGRLLDTGMHSSPASLSAEHFSRRGLETEFAFRLTSDLPAHAAPFDRAAVVAAASELLPAIEIIDSRFSSWPEISPFSFIADNGTHGCFVMGQTHSDWAGHDLSTQAARISVNEQLVNEGSGADVLGDPVNALVWLANRLPADGKELKAGDVITTGTAAGVVWCGAGDAAVADFGPFGLVTVSFA
tara:strand:+ start:125 stop:907 length:783 start_codon:yes stop_codon:yes gene_type:complete